VRLSPDERAFFQEVEAHFIRLRGRPLLLSPRELARVAGWQREGIPLQVVLRGIDRYFEKRFSHQDRKAREKAVSLAWCEKQVRQVFEESRHLAVGDGEQALAEESQLQLALATLGQQLKQSVAAGAEPSDPLGGLLHEALEEVSLMLVQTREGALAVADAETRLERLDRRLLDELRRQAGPDSLEQLRSACDAEISEISASMDPPLREATLERMITRRLRRSRQIPQLSLFTL